MSLHRSRNDTVKVIEEVEGINSESLDQPSSLKEHKNVARILDFLI